MPDACVLDLSLDPDLQEREKASGRAVPRPGAKAIEAP